MEAVDLLHQYSDPDRKSELVHWKPVDLHIPYYGGFVRNGQFIAMKQWAASGYALSVEIADHDPASVLCAPAGRKTCRLLGKKNLEPDVWVWIAEPWPERIAVYGGARGLKWAVEQLKLAEAHIRLGGHPHPEPGEADCDAEADG